MSIPKSGPLSVQSIWSRVQGSVSQRGTTAAVFAAVRAEAETTGTPLPQGWFRTVNQLRSMAVSLRNGTEALATATNDQVISGNMLGITPYSRPLDQQTLAPRYHVSFQQLIQTDTGVSYVWRSDVITGSLPTTKGDLLRALDVTGELLAKKYNVVHAGIGLVQIAAV